MLKTWILSSPPCARDRGAEVAALKAENEMLRKVLKDADNEMDWLDEEVDTCDHSYWSVRRKMKAALAKGEGK